MAIDILIIHFFAGKRQCLGESVAKMELFLFASAILKNFEIFEPDNKPITLEPISDISILNMPQDQELILKFRN